MFQTLAKFKKRVEELNTYRFLGMQSIAPFFMFEEEKGPDEVRNEIPQELYQSDQVFSCNDIFEGRDRYLWLYRDVRFPERRDDCEVVGLFDFGKTGDGTIRGFESMLYLDGHPYQGVDTFHPDVNFDSFGGQTVRLTFMLWTGLEGGGRPQVLRHLFRRADVGYLHKATDELYYYARAVTETLEQISKDDPAYADNVAAMEAMLRLIDWDEDSFYESVPAALDCLKKHLRAAKQSTGVTVNCVGHTHIDVAWLWRLKHTREKAMRSFSTVNRLMNEFEDYCFLQSQPQLYDDIKRDQPEIYGYIKNRVKEGRWEPDGGMWLEADCNIPSGESLIRQLFYGIRFMKDEFDHECRYLWLPDVFGYSWALPQILNGCNISTFMTTKISWNQYNTIPNDLFLWRGIDGSEILTYFMTTPLDGEDIRNRFSTYNGLLTPHSVLGSWTKFKNKDISREVLIAYGYGDGGGGVNRDMLKLAHAMQDVPGLPDIRFSGAGSFFERLHESAEHNDGYLPTWDGELYLEYHRGTYTSQAANKKNNRLYENRLVRSEWLSVLSSRLGGNYDHDALEYCWKILLRNQFHDIIPGSSIHEVYEDSDSEYRNLAQHLMQQDDIAYRTICKPLDDCLTVINDASFGGMRIVCLSNDHDASYCDQDGNLLPVQRLEDKLLVALPMSPFSLKTIEKTAEILPQSVVPFIVDIEAGEIETPYYRIMWDENGQLSTVYDKQNDREVLAEKANVLRVYEDRPCNFDAWDIDLFYTLKEPEQPQLVSCQLLGNGDICCAIRFVYQYRHSVLQQDMVVYAHSRRIDFVTKIDWHESHRLLKAAFPVDVRSTKATFDIQCGHVERPTHYNTSWDYARFEVCTHKWMDLSDDSYGVSLLNDCKYGCNVHDNEMQITLLKSAKDPDYAADMGEHTFTYALLPHAGRVTECDTISESHFLNHPTLVTRGSADSLTPQLTFSGNIIVDAIKQAEDNTDIVVRFHECCGGRTDAVLHFSDMQSWTLCNMLEQELAPCVDADNVSLTLRPFEIVTVRLHMR